MTFFVFDTNVIVSALLLNDSVPGRAFVPALNHGTILVSGALMGELSRVLSRDRFDRYLSREERDEFLESLIEESDLIEITELVQACRDPEDDRVLELAINGNATYIVTGDADLLLLNPFRGLKIVTPAGIPESTGLTMEAVHQHDEIPKSNYRYRVRTATIRL